MFLIYRNTANTSQNAFVNPGAVCECHQSGHRVVFYPEPVAMSTTSCQLAAY